MDYNFAQPLEVSGMVERVFDAAFTVSRDHFAGMEFDMGVCCTLALAYDGLQGGGSRLLII